MLSVESLVYRLELPGILQLYITPGIITRTIILFKLTHGTPGAFKHQQSGYDSFVKYGGFHQHDRGVEV